LVNIYDLLDSQRNGRVFVFFKDFERLGDSSLHGRTYPSEKAMASTFLPIFLKELSPKRND
jgi:hypothetical protein